MKVVKDKACEAIFSFETIQSDVKREIDNAIMEDEMAQSRENIFEGNSAVKFVIVRIDATVYYR